MKDAEIDLQKELNSHQSDTLDAILKRLLDGGADPSQVLRSNVVVDEDAVIDDFQGDLFNLVSDYTDALDAIGMTERDPLKVIEQIAERIKAEALVDPNAPDDPDVPDDMPVPADPDQE